MLKSCFIAMLYFVTMRIIGGICERKPAQRFSGPQQAVPLAPGSLQRGAARRQPGRGLGYRGLVHRAERTRGAGSGDLLWYSWQRNGTDRAVRTVAASAGRRRAALPAASVTDFR